MNNEEELTETPQEQARERTPAPTWTRRYPPLASLAVALLIAFSILPSTLNLPSSNPTEVLEYAPIPPEDQDQPPPMTRGALSSLGVASTGTLLTSPDLPPEIDALAKRPLTKKCVGGRQTEDPNSPPCQPYFEGDNGGVTYQGVNRDQINVLIYETAWTATIGGSRGTETPPPHGTYCDVDLMDCNGDGKPDDNPHEFLRIHNAYSRYFSARFQTYGRHVKAWMYWSNKRQTAGRKADAADNWVRLKPFAVQPTAGLGFLEDYVDAMAKRNIMVFTNFSGYPATYYQRYAPKVWSYYPTSEIWADMFTGYLCDKVKGTVVNHGPYAGQERRYGLLWTSDPAFEGLRTFKNKVIEGAKACGVLTGNEPSRTFPYAGYEYDFYEADTYSQPNMAYFQNAYNRLGANTLIWFGGLETKQTHSAVNIGYFPEFIVAGDGELEGNQTSRTQHRESWQNAWVMTQQVRTGRTAEDPAYVAYKEAEPDGEDYGWALASGHYQFWMMLMTGVQVAGPRLTPETLSAGMHAIQRRRSLSPFIPSFYFLPNDYTGVKDATEMWWDPNERTEGGGQGCWRLVNQGLRYPFEGWAESKIGINGPLSYRASEYGRTNNTPGQAGGDPCSLYSVSGIIRGPRSPGT